MKVAQSFYCRFLLIACVVLFFGIFTDAAMGDITYVGDIGSGTQSGTSNATLTIAVPSSKSITAGDAIIIAYATDAAPDIELTITNSWSTTDKYQLAAMAVSSAQNRTFIFAAYNVSGLTAGSGNTITITQTIPTSGTTPNYRAAVAAEFSGLAPVGALEQSSNGPANTTATSSTSPSSGAITTVQPVQLLIGAVGRKGVTTTEGAGTWGGGFTDGPFVNGLSSGEDVSMGYQIVSSSGSYTASKTIPTARYWTAAIASFKTTTTGSISYIWDIGRAQSKTAGTSLDITTNADVVAGDDILIAFAADVASGTPSVSDGVNTYNYISGADATSTGHVRTTIFAAYNVTALPSGSHIVITHTSLTARAGVVSVFRGLATSAALDQTHTGNSTSGGTTPSSGATGTTAQADELLIGAVGTEGGNYDAPGTWSTAFSQGPRLGTSFGTTTSATSDITASMGWKIVSATAAYTAAKGGIGSKPWAASIATFKAAAAPAGPTVTIDQASEQADPTASSPINFTVVFSEEVTGFETGDVTLTGTAGATTGTVTGSGATYNVAVSGMTGSGTVIASIAAGVAQNGSAQNNEASTSTDNTVTYDVTGPTVTINQASGQDDPTNISSINFTVVFSEAVTDFVTGDVTLTGTAGATTGTVTEIAPNDGTTYNVAVSGMTGSGTVIASIAAGATHDALANANDASTSTDNTVTYDDIDPTVTINQAAGQDDPTDSSPINFTVVFSEPVADFATGDVTLSGTAGATTDVVSEIAPNDGTTYNVAVSGMTASGTVIASVASSVAHDEAGNPNDVGTSTDNSVTFEYVAPPLGLDGAVSSGTADGVSSINVTHTTGTSTDRLMLVGVSANSYNGARTISSVTFTPSGGSATSLTVVGSIENEAGRLAAIYSLLNPPSGVSGTVMVTFSGSVAYGIVVGVANFAGVDQSDPLDDFVSAVGTETSAISVDASTDEDDLVFDTVFLGSATPVTSLTADASQSQLWDATVDRVRGVASTEQATTTTTTMSWTASGSTTTYYWAIGAVPINPAPTATTYDLTMAVDPVGSGTTDPAVGVHNYPEDEEVTITATPATGYEFDHWEGDVEDPDEASTTVTMDEDQAVTAHFTLIPTTVKVAAKVFLEGPYDTDANVMTTSLTVPTTSPYSEDAHTLSGSVPADITDWVLVQLRSTADGSAVASKSALLHKDGSIVADDGSTNEIEMTASAGDYYIVIKHRNHLSVMSASTVALTSSSATLYDFTSGSSQFYGTAGAKLLETGVWGLWSGEIYQDGYITTQDYTDWYNSARAGDSGYHDTDCNCDGQVTTEDYTIWYNNARAGASSQVP